MKNIRRMFGCILASIYVANAVAADDSAPREKLLMDSGWSFHLGNDWGSGLNLTKAASSTGPASANFNDTNWRKVNLPHDWVVELPFDKNSDMAHGYKPVGQGFQQNNVAWYRRAFDLPKADSGKRLWLDFDGVYRNCDVFVNGWFVGNHKSGYDGFRYDITDVANYGGKNVVAVRVDASEFEGWFYEGAGIYRHVWLEKTSPVAIAPDGLFVSYSNVLSREPLVRMQTTIKNDSDVDYSFNVVLHSHIFKPNGEQALPGRWGGGEVGRALIGSLKSHSQLVVDQGQYIAPPELWSPESPKLYKLVTTVEVDGKIVDRKETEFGIRTVAFDKDKGFLLNGQPYAIQGTCNHQDMAGVGAALPDALQSFRIAKLKEMGDNAYRTSHNAPTPELLEACDRLGMLVLDENRIVGSDEANLNYLQGQILRDRNHPSVFAWSLGNEEWGSQGTVSGAASIQTMQNLAHSLDPTRECTAAVNGSYGNTGFITVLDVKGFNYNLGSIDPYRRNHTNSFFIGTETASTVTTRGIYANDLAKGYVAAYDYITKTKSGALVNPVTWGETSEQWWSFYATRPWMSGGFAWTGFDYRGEPTPYEWPCINSHFGILDMCGFPKDNFYYYQSWWTTNTVLHLLPHWNWPGREGQDIDVRAFSNCEEVELFLNGQSLGRQTMKKNSHLQWSVKYAPGVLSAKGFNGGKLVAETKVETTGEPFAVQLAPDRATINADGEDVSVIAVSVTDAQGRMVPVATNLFHFELTGPGKIIGVGNGDPSCHEPDQFISHPPFSSKPVDDWRWQKISDATATNLPETAEQFDDSAWQKADVHSATGPLQGETKAAFRAHINVTAEDLAAVSVELNFGMIDDEGYVYVNGQKVGESHDWSAAPAFDVKRFLHPGQNTIVVAVVNATGAGGVNKGVSLKFQQNPAPADWQRSAFNGLAQILVQSTKEPGEIKLTATAEGLPPATLSVQSQPSTPRPFVP
jgi:beta-galactosidase